MKFISMTALALLVAPIFPIAAQESDGAQGEPRNVAGPPDDRTAEDTETIDLLVRPTRGEIDQRRIEECEREQDSARISREIVVCREIVDRSDRYTTGSREDTQRRYAEETAFAGDLLPPDVAGPGIFRGPATAGSLCIPGLQKCPPPPALMIDVTALPEAPPGSDADRIARGLPPLGSSGDSGREEVSEEGQLGLPPPLSAKAGPGPISLSGSAEPEEDQ